MHVGPQIIHKVLNCLIRKNQTFLTRQIREEVCKIREQEKRRQSVIIGGLGASSPREAANLLTTLSQSMFGVGVELTDVVSIPNHQDLFRAKILYEEHRRLILTRAKSLRDTDYGHVYIKRDLTYNQRKELKGQYYIFL